MRFKDLKLVVAKRHMRLHAVVMPFIDEALSIAEGLEFDVGSDGFASVTVDFNREIGLCDRVATSDDDEIVYAIRPGRTRHTRFVMNRIREATSKLTMVLHRESDKWRLISSWFGEAAKRDPQDNNQTPAERLEAIEFWSKQALVWGCQPVFKETMTTECPWIAEYA